VGCVTESWPGDSLPQSCGCKTAVIVLKRSNPRLLEADFLTFATAGGSDSACGSIATRRWTFLEPASWKYVIIVVMRSV
jgi:hypothetical protein